MKIIRNLVFWFMILISWMINVYSYDWNEIDVYISWKFVNELWEPIKNQKLTISSKFREVNTFTDSEWLFNTKFKIPTWVDRSKWEYYYAVWVEYSRWASFSDLTNWMTFVYSEEEWRILKFKWSKNHVWVVKQLKKPVEEYYVPTEWWFFKFFILIMFLFFFIVWLNLRETL